MIDCTERSEGQESMTFGSVMIDCTERSEGQESMTFRSVIAACTERHSAAADDGLAREGQKDMTKEAQS
jgi:hypothetical protein